MSDHFYRPLCVAAVLAASTLVLSNASAATSGPPGPINAPVTDFGSPGYDYVPSNNYAPNNEGNSPVVSPTCGIGTLASYENLGFNGCTIGAVTFYHFVQPVNPSSGALYNPADPIARPNGPPTPATSFNASLITVTPNGDPAAPGFTFSSSLFTLASGQASYVFEYYIDPPIDIIGFRLADDPFVGATSVRADICENFQYNNNCNFLEDPTITLTQTDTSLDTPFNDGTQFADVVLTVNLDASNGPATIPAFSAQALPVSTVPEPADLGLLGIGVATLLGAQMANRRRRMTKWGSAALR